MISVFSVVKNPWKRTIRVHSGRVFQINVSGGGVPKRAVPSARVTTNGVQGDAQADTKHHGGPERAVCLFSLEVIRRLQAEGHPIAPGTIGENLTIEGIDWSQVGPGSRFEFDGGVVLEVTKFTSPCATIRDSFTDLEFRRVKQEMHAGESRVYARVVKEGVIQDRERLRHLPAR